MKTFLLPIAFALTFVTSSAISQILITDPSDLTTDLSGTTYLVEKENTEFIVYADLRLVNNSGSEATLKFKRIRTVNSGLTDQLCYGAICTNAGNVTEYVWSDMITVNDGEDILFKPQILNVMEAEFDALHTYEVMDVNDNVLASIVVEFKVESSANLALLKKDFEKTTVYPNPARDVFTIKTAKNTKVDVVITDALGKEVYRKQDFNSNSINVLNLNNGVYFVKVYNHDLRLTETRKLIVKK
jgi:hypothetical protein